MDELLDELAYELGKTEIAKVQYDEQINAVVINGDAIQIFAHVIHVNPNFYYFKLNTKAVKTINKIQKELAEVVWLLATIIIVVIINN